MAMLKSAAEALNMKVNAVEAPEGRGNLILPAASLAAQHALCPGVNQFVGVLKEP